MHKQKAPNCYVALSGNYQTLVLLSRAGVLTMGKDLFNLFCDWQVWFEVFFLKRCEKYQYPVVKYSVTCGLKSPKCLGSCFCRFLPFAWGNPALFEIRFAKIQIHTPFNANSFCTLRENKNRKQEDNYGSISCHTPTSAFHHLADPPVSSCQEADCCDGTSIASSSVHKGS